MAVHQLWSFAERASAIAALVHFSEFFLQATLCAGPRRMSILPPLQRWEQEEVAPTVIAVMLHCQILCLGHRRLHQVQHLHQQVRRRQSLDKRKIDA